MLYCMWESNVVVVLFFEKSFFILPKSLNCNTIWFCYRFRFVTVWFFFSFSGTQMHFHPSIISWYQSDIQFFYWWWMPFSASTKPSIVINFSHIFSLLNRQAYFPIHFCCCCFLFYFGRMLLYIDFLFLF